MNEAVTRFDWAKADALHWQQGKIDPYALADLLNLAVGECAELADLDPQSGDYRVYHVAFGKTPQGRLQLAMELHRQGPGFAARIFPVLQIRFAPADAQGLAVLESFQCDAGMTAIEFPRCLPWLALIVAGLQEGKRPDDAWLAPLLSRAAKILWVKSLPGVAA